MLQKIRKTILVMAAAVIVLSPAAKAAEYSTQSAQNEENCISWILQALQQDKTKRSRKRRNSLLRQKVALKCRMAGCTIIRTASWMCTSRVLYRSRMAFIMFPQREA